MGEKTAFYSADGDFLLASQHGALNMERPGLVEISSSPTSRFVTPQRKSSQSGVCKYPRGMVLQAFLPGRSFPQQLRLAPL